MLKKTDESQSESQSTPTKLNDTISPNKRKHEGDEEESPKRRKIEKTPEKVHLRRYTTSRDVLYHLDINMVIIDARDRYDAR